MKRDDPSENYRRQQDLIFQEMEDRRVSELLAGLQAVGPKATEEDVRLLREEMQKIGVREGKTEAEARAWADAMLTRGLELNLFDENLDVRDPDEEKV